MRVNRHKQKSKPTVYVYNSLTLSNEEEGVVASGSYDIYTRCLRLMDRRKGGQGVQGRLHYATTTTK